MHQVCLSKYLLCAVRDYKTQTRAYSSACDSLLDPCTPHVRHLAASHLLKILSFSSHILRHHEVGYTCVACLQIWHLWYRQIMQSHGITEGKLPSSTPARSSSADAASRAGTAQAAAGTPQHSNLWLVQYTLHLHINQRKHIFLIPRTGLSSYDHLLHQICYKATPL